MNMSPLPHHYSVSLKGGSLWSEERAPIPIGAPPQFGGSGLVWSPEELLVGAVLSCVRTTFDAYAARKGLVVRDWSGTAEGVLDKSRTGPVFTSIRLVITLEVEPGDEERAAEILERAEKDCIITVAVKAPVEMTMEVRTAPAADAGGP
jgi:organic hydroperoxide reductase OsmC/OhrA